jgi:hypothetical protein
MYTRTLQHRDWPSAALNHVTVAAAETARVNGEGAAYKASTPHPRIAP